MQMMVQDPNQQKDVQAISILVQYIAQKVSEMLSPLLLTTLLLLVYRK